MSKIATKVTKKTPVEKLLKLRMKMAALATLSEAMALDIAVKLYLIALLLRDDVDEWQTFCEHADWEIASPTPQAKDDSRKKALQFAVGFAVGFKKDANSNRVRKFYDILKVAWDDDVVGNEIEPHVKKVQAEQREKAAETRAKRKATAVRSIKLLPSEASQLVTTRTGNLALKGEFKINDAGGPMMSLEITRLSEKSLKKLGVTNPQRRNPQARDPRRG